MTNNKLTKCEYKDFLFKHIYENENKEKYAYLMGVIDKALEKVPKDYSLHNLDEKKRNETISFSKTEFKAKIHDKARDEEGIEGGKERKTREANIALVLCQKKN